MIYRIAELTIEMDTFGRTLCQAEPYQISEADDIDFVIQPDEVIVRKFNSRLSQSDVEYMATGQNFRKQILDYNGMVIHASAVVKDGKAYLFTANSGTGKSTHTRLWRQVYGNEFVYILNDDKPALRKIDGIWYAYGTPWSGKHDLNTNEKVPLAGICILERGTENQIQRCNAKQALYKLLSFSGRSRTVATIDKILKVLDQILTEVPIWRMECNMDPEAAVVSYETMAGIRKAE